MQERQDRIPFTRPVFVAPLAGPGRPHRLLTGNISEGGMFVRSESRFDPGTPVSISLEARGQVLPFAHAEVVWDADVEQLSQAGELPGFGLRFTRFLNEGSTALLSHLVHRSPGVNVSERLTNRLDPDPVDASEPEFLDDLGGAEPEVEWPAGIGVRAPAAALDASDRPSFRLDLEGERAEVAPPKPAELSPEQTRRVAVAAAVGIGVLIVATVLLLRMRSDTPELTAEGTQAFPAMDLAAEPAPTDAPVPDVTASPASASASASASAAAAAPALTPTPAPTPAPAPRATAAPAREFAPAPEPSTEKVSQAARTTRPAAPTSSASLSLSSGAVTGIRASRTGSTLDVTLNLAPGARIERAFALTSPSRLVIDVDGAAPRASVRRDADLPAVKGVRVGARSGGTRIVLDLERPAGKVDTTRSGARVALK